MFEAANRRDAKAGTLLFTREADFVNVLGMWWKGAAEIEHEWAARFGTGLKGATFKVVDVRISFLEPDVALSQVTSEITGFVGPDGQLVAPHKERTVASSMPLRKQ